MNEFKNKLDAREKDKVTDEPGELSSKRLVMRRLLWTRVPRLVSSRMTMRSALQKTRLLRRDRPR